MNKCVLVTGGSGFIGTWVLRKLLQQNCRVIVYDVADGGERWAKLLGERRSEITFVAGDLLNSERLERVFDDYPIDAIIHLAAWLTPPCQLDPYKGCEINVLGTMRLFELVRHAKHPITGFAYASSVAVYGPEADDAAPAANSVQALGPQTFYGAFKKANELIAMQYWLHFGIASVGLRPFVVYGPGREHGLTAGPTLAARAVALGEAYTLPFSGTTGYDFVEDTACAFVRCALEVQNSCCVVDLPGIQASVDEVIAVLEAIKPGSRPLLSVDGPALPFTIDTEEFGIERLFSDWKLTPLEEGLRQVVSYYEAAV